MRKIVELKEAVKIGDRLLGKGTKIKVQEKTVDISTVKSNIDKVIKKYEGYVSDAEKHGDKSTAKMHKDDIKDMEEIKDLLDDSWKRAFNAYDSLDTAVRDDLYKTGILDLANIYNDLIEYATTGYGDDIINFLKDMSKPQSLERLSFEEMLEYSNAIEKMYGLLPY